MYMLIPMNFIILGNYVDVDSTGFLNACKLCVSIQLGFGILINTVYVDPNEFIILANYVYVDSNGFYNTCKLCICWFYWGFECL